LYKYVGLTLTGSGEGMSSNSMVSVPVHADRGDTGRRPVASNPESTLILLPVGHRVVPHTAPGHGVVLLVIAGSGTLATRHGLQDLDAGVLLWLPHGSARSVVAGNRGLAYLTVRRS
jgi:quercetin dioxygenase-like cupin family protein